MYVIYKYMYNLIMVIDYNLYRQCLQITTSVLQCCRCMFSAPGCSLNNISNRFTKKTPCILNLVVTYLNMKVVTTGMFCQANISTCVVFLVYCIQLHTRVYCMLHTCIGCYTHADICYYATLVLSLQCACHMHATHVGCICCG